LQKTIADKMPQSRWFAYEPIDLQADAKAASKLFGKSVRPKYNFDAAKVIVSLDSDFIGSEEDAYRNITGFSKNRHLESAKDDMNRLYVVESLMTLTGANADHRLRIPASSVPAFAAALAREVFKQAGNGLELPNLGAVAGKEAQFIEKWAQECAADLSQARGASLVLAGYRQPAGVHALAVGLNQALGNIGKTVDFLETPDAKEENIADLAQALNAGKIDTLVILSSNPAYNAPGDLNWNDAVKKAKTVVRLGYSEDESYAASTWHLPAAHFLESWGDALTTDGTLVPIQPLIAPLFGGITELEVLARIAGASTTNPYEVARETFAAYQKGQNVEEAWKKYLHDGFLANSAQKPADVSTKGHDLRQSFQNFKVTAPSASSLEVVFHRDYSVDDGRFNNNGWLQEMPDPITKMVWENAVLISRRTAQELQVQNGDVVEITVGNATISGPIWVQPGQADYSLGLAVGYGRGKSGRVGRGTGFNAYPLRTTANPYIATGAQLRKTGRKHQLVCTQDHWSMEGRPIIREATKEQYAEHPDFAKRMNMEEPPTGQVSLYPNPFDKLKQSGIHQWGMSIDLNKCVGCQACMMACQSENNVPIVGKDQVRRGREMHWIRLDRYYSGPLTEHATREVFQRENKQQFEKWIDEPQVVTQPMLCQHCEAAPCESVCPVNATVHDQEGLNLMVYNRCVGTRYCSNNCPYKVRRFNFFDFNKRPLDGLYWGPLKKRPEEEYELTKMVKNPDVTVRMRGVMEKCTFCIQRIEGAKIAQKVKAGASGDVVVPTDSFTTACAQACPADAIVFGNLKDPNSRVSKLKHLDRDYAVLEFLYTRPRLTYLAKVRNPNKRMPDYEQQYAPGTYNFQEYEKHSGNPFEEETESRAGAASGKAREEGGRL
jgi:molybdopterin-containing oxidoreductase family iron-sulfur binding subunit